VTTPAEDDQEATAKGPAGHATQHHLDLVVFKVCVAAIWVDGSMAAAERDHVSHLIDTIAPTEAESNDLRRLALHDVNQHEVLTEVDGLDANQKQHVFDRCVRLLTSDRRLTRRELGFLGRLRRRCGIGYWRYHQLLGRLTAGRRLVMLLVLAVVAAAAWWSLVDHQVEGHPPVEAAGFEEVLVAAPPPGSIEVGSEDLYQLVRNSVVTVNVEIGGARHGNGSGSVIGVDRLGQLYVLTNRHVVIHNLAEGQDIAYTAELESGIQLPAVLDFYSRSVDLALLVVPGLTGWARPLPIVPRSLLRVGQHVYAVGSPLGLKNTFTTGVISALRADSIQTDATVHSGSSGGPLLDAAGSLCGIITATHLYKDVSFALYGDLVLTMLEERREIKTGGSSGGRSEPAL